MIRLRLMTLGSAILTAAVCPPSYAQATQKPLELFSQLDLNASTLSHNPWPAPPGLLRTRLVTINSSNLPQPASGGIGPVTLNLFDGANFHVVFHSLIRRSAQSYTVFGQVSDDALSDVVITVVDGAVAGEVRTGDGRVFDLTGIAGGLYEIREIDEALSPLCGPVGTPPAILAPAPDEKSASILKQDNGAEIDVLFVYTPLVTSFFGSQAQVEAVVHRAVDGSNEALTNSLTGTQYRVVGIEEIVYTETGSGSVELNRLTNGGDGFMDNVHTMRNNVGADLVCLLLNWTGDNFAGHAWILPNLSTANQGLGFSVVRRDSITRFIVAHELGHNMGCDHDRNNASGTRLFPFSFGHQFNFTRTIMAYPPGFWISHYSNPTVLFNGLPTGVADGQPDSADNALTIATSRTTVALYRRALLPSVSIAGDRQVVETDSGSHNLNFIATLSFSVANTVNASFATQNGTAISGSDYTATSGTIFFPPNTTAVQISVPILGDVAPEGDETFTLSLSNPVGAIVLNGTGQGTILNDDLTTFSLFPAALNEGDTGTTNATIFVPISGTGPLAVSVDYTTVDETAVDGIDYTAVSGTLAFPPNTGGPGMIFVPIIGNTVDDGIKFFRVLLSNPVNAQIVLNNVLYPILDEEGPTFSIDDVSVTEGNSGSVNAVFTVTPSATSPDSILVDFRTADDTATDFFFDYVPVSGRLQWASNDATPKTITVQVNGDLLGEADETFSVFLMDPLNATIADAQGVGTILNDDGSQVSISLSDASLTEGDAGMTNMDFTVTLSAAAPMDVMVDFFATEGTATDGDDFDQANTFGTVTFPASTTTPQIISVPVFGDTLAEADETFSVSLNVPINAVIDDGDGLGTIFNDDGTPPTLAIGDVMITEGNAGTANALFPVTLSAPIAASVTVDYRILEDTATGGDDYDNSSVTGTVTFPASSTSPQQITVPVFGDIIPEMDETFTVVLSNPANAILNNDTAVGTILNDDGAPPTLSISDAAISEGNVGQVANATFNVTLSSTTPATVMVDFFATEGTATDGEDFDQSGTFGTVTFPPNTTGPQQITVPIFGDDVPETDETFTVSLNAPVNAAIADGTAQGTILNDDAAPPTLSINDVSIAEGNAGQMPIAIFDVTLSSTTPATVTVDFFATEGTATDAVDFDQAGTFGTLTFPPNTTGPQQISVTIFGDDVPEPDETFTVSLNAPVNAAIADGTGQGTILNDDVLPTLSINDVSITEGNAGSTPTATFSVTLSATTPATVSVDYFATEGTATDVEDFDQAGTFGTLTFPPNTTGPQQISVTIFGDDVPEPDETFTVSLNAPVNATIADGTGLGTIVNDDGPIIMEGMGEGMAEGTGEGMAEGTGEGMAEGTGEGMAEGTGEGMAEGTGEGMAEGAGEGMAEGTGEGMAEGTGEGAPDQTPPKLPGCGSVSPGLGQNPNGITDFLAFIIVACALFAYSRTRRTSEDDCRL